MILIMKKDIRDYIDVEILRRMNAAASDACAE